VVRVRDALDREWALKLARKKQLSAAGRERFRAEAKAWEWFEGQSAYYRRAATHWVISAKRPETRERRLAQLIADSAAGQRVPPLAPR